MTFSENLTQVVELLRQQGRVSYPALKRHFDLDDDYLADLKAELIDALHLATDENGKVLVWAGDGPVSITLPPPKPVPTPASYTPNHLAERIRSQQQAMEARGAQEGERKTITVLFADLKGSTALLEGLDPEVARAVIDPALQIMMDAVHRYEGYVAQALGDGILALFGAPLAHEDHAQRAVFAALRMQDELRRYSDEVRLKHGAPLAMRVGLNTGEVVVRSIRKDDLHTDYVPVGHSINLAARMEQMATPGSILITAHTQKLVEGYFLLKALGEAAIKGMEQPLAVYEVTGVGQFRTRLQVAARRGLTRFVGRQQELAQMQRALEQTRAGRGQVIGIMGEPGMGKSRLVLEFKLSASGFAVFEAYSASHGKASPYLPITELLKGYFQIQLQDDDRTRREKVIGKLLGLDRNLEEMLPYYFALLNIDDPASPLPQMDPQTRRRKTFDALKRATLRASLEQPLLLIFEDLHWIDSETQGYLDSLVESLGSARILLLTNYRPEYRHEWGGKSYCTQLRLAPFGRAEAEEFLGVLLGEAADLNAVGRLANLKQWILERTEGTPFFMEEVVQELFEQGVLVRDGAERIAMPGITITQIQLPTTVQGVLAARIDRLTVDEKALLQQLSVIGREFAFSLARQVVDLQEEVLHRLLDSLQRKEFLYEQPAFPEVEYIFKHALTQEVAYNSLLQERRRGIHEQTARAIETIYQHELNDHYGNLAHHYSRSGNVEKAIVYLEHAGQQAADRAAVADAVSYLSDALEFLKQTPESPSRERKELDLILALIPSVHMNMGMSSIALEEICTRARGLCERAGGPADLLPVLVELRTCSCVRGDCFAALEYSRELMKLAETVQDSTFHLHAHAAMAVSLFFLGDVKGSLLHAARGRELYEFEQHRTQILKCGFDPLALVLWYEAIGLWILGFPQQAQKYAEESTSLAQRIGHPHLLGMATATWVPLFALGREPAECMIQTEAVIALALEHEFPDWLNYGMAIQGWALEAGGNREGLGRLVHGIGVLRAARAELMIPFLQILHAEVHLRRDAPEAARLAVEEGLEIAIRNGEVTWDAEIYRLLGEIALKESGDIAEQMRAAETHFEKAIKLAQDQTAKSWELRATLSLAKLWSSQGRMAEAHARLAPLYAWFTEGFDTPDLQEAHALLLRLA